jgi:uncharacterized protein
MQLQATKLIEQVRHWAPKQLGIIGVLLVGSYGRNAARVDSDVDLILFTNDLEPWLTHTEWLCDFGTLERVEFEDWVGVKTQRAHFKDGFEVEFNFATPEWASIDPIEPGTFRVVSDGAQAIFDPEGFLERLIEKVKAKG